MADSNSSSKPFVLVLVGVLVIAAVLFAVTRGGPGEESAGSPTKNEKVENKPESKGDAPEEVRRDGKNERGGGKQDPVLTKQYNLNDVLERLTPICESARVELAELQANLPGAVNEEDRLEFRAQLDAIEDPEERRRLVLERQAKWREEAKKQTSEQKSRQMRLASLSNLGAWLRLTKDIDECGDFDEELQFVYAKFEIISREAEAMTDRQVKSSTDALAGELRTLRGKYNVLYPPPDLNENPTGEGASGEQPGSTQPESGEAKPGSNE